MIDERLGRPSASAFHIDAHCPGRWQLLESMRPQISAAMFESDEGAERGTRIHKARETLNPTLLKDAGEVAAYNNGIKLERAAVSNWTREFSPNSNDVTEGERELRLWMYDAQGQPILSGKMDVHYILPGRLYLQDWKSGGCVNLEPAKRNWQMKICAVLARHYYGATHVRVGLNKMEYGTGVVDEHDYDEQGLAVAEWEIMRKLDEMKEPDAPRYAGKWCTYCPCRGGQCPEAAATTMVPMVVAGVATLTDKDRIRELVSRLSVEQMQYVYSKRKTIEHIMDAVGDSLRDRTPSELSRVGFKLTPGKKTRKVSNSATEAAIGKLAAALSLTDEEAWKCLNLDLGACEEAAQKVKGLSEANAKRTVEGLLGELIEVKYGEPIIREL